MVLGCAKPGKESRSGNRTHAGVNEVDSIWTTRLTATARNVPGRERAAFIQTALNARLEFQPNQDSDDRIRNLLVLFNSMPMSSTNILFDGAAGLI